MERAITRIALDVQKLDSGELIRAKRGDSARQLTVSLTNRGSPYAPGDGVTAVFCARKADGVPCFNEARIDGSTVTYDFTGQTTNVEGMAACEIRLYDAGGHLLTSPRFEMLVDGTEYQDGDVPDSSPEFTALTEMVSKGTELIQDLTDVQARLEPIRDAAIEAASSAQASADHADTQAQAAQHYALNAGDSATMASKSAAGTAANAERAEAAAGAAATYADDAQTHAETAGNYAQRAEEAAERAENAQGDGDGTAVDLTGYATEEWVQEGYQPKGNYLTEAGANGVITNLLDEAKKNGEFDGADGRGIKSITRTSGNGAAGTVDTYTIYYSDGTTSTYQVRNGADGAQGPAYTLSEADKATITAAVVAALPKYAGEVAEA